MTDDHPLVSVIVPVYNDPEGIRNCLSALQDQTYPTERYEVLAVDNGSTDETPNVIRRFDDVTLLVEDEVQGSYAARNCGIEEASGEILVFTDADCTPDREWIAAGVDALQREDADIAAGRIVFEFSEDKSAAERFDASVNMRNDESVLNGVAKTANIFIRTLAMEKIGLFPQHLISGGDVYWTRSATDAGHEIVYTEEATVKHPSRQLRELLKKQYRVGKGQTQIWRLDDRSVAFIILSGLLRFPLKMARFLFGSSKDANRDRNTPSDRDINRDLAVVITAGLCVVAMNFGRIVRLITSR